MLLEMQACGIPVVTTRHADIPFVMAERDDLVAEEDVEGLADALVGVSELSAADWLARAERGRAVVAERHDARRCAEQMDDIYAEAFRVHSST